MSNWPLVARVYVQISCSCDVVATLPCPVPLRDDRQDSLGLARPVDLLYGSCSVSPPTPSSSGKVLVVLVSSQVKMPKIQPFLHASVNLPLGCLRQMSVPPTFYPIRLQVRKIGVHDLPIASARCLAMTNSYLWAMSVSRSMAPDACLARLAT
jgi:hypothetical protein